MTEWLVTPEIGKLVAVDTLAANLAWPILSFGEASWTLLIGDAQISNLELIGSNLSPTTTTSAIAYDNSSPLVSQTVWVLLGCLARIIPFLILAPPTQAACIPRRLRLGFAFCLAMMIGPYAADTALPSPSDGLHLIVMLGSEVAYGLLLGTVALLAVVGLQVTGQLASQLIGFDFATTRGLDENASPMLNHLLTWIALIVVLTAGGHRLMLAACLDSFGTYPIGSLMNVGQWLGELQWMLGHTFAFGLRVGAPIGFALLLSNVITGLISRVLPQASLLAVGFNLNTMVLLTVLFLSVGGIGWTFQSELGTWLDGLHRLIQDS